MELEVKRKYQWVSGPRTNGLEVYLAEDNENIWFESGRSVPKDRFDILLRQIDDATYNSLNSAKSERERIQDLLGTTSGMNQITGDIAPELLGSSPAPTPQPEPVKVIEENPISLILKKQKKLEKVDVKMNMPVEIPSAKVYEFLTMMFDEDEVLDIISKEISDKFTKEDMQSIVRNSIIKYYEENKQS
jgi:hypothetical protein